MTQADTQNVRAPCALPAPPACFLDPHLYCVAAAVLLLCGCRGLSLGQNGFSSLLPPFVGAEGQLPAALCTLDLSSNQFHGPIPESYANFPQLTSLNVGRNQLTGTLPTFPEGSSLQFLVVNDNRLSGPLPTMNLQSLLIFDATANEFSGPLDLTRLQAPLLMDLRLNGNQLSCPIVVPPNSRIQRLSLGSNLFNESCDGGMDFLSSMAHLQVFDGSNNAWSGELPLYLPQEMRSFHCMRCGLDTELPGPWQFHPTLSLLFLSGNRVRGTTNSMAFGLTTLDLSNCSFSGDIFNSLTYLVSHRNIAHNGRTGAFI